MRKQSNPYRNKALVILMESGRISKYGIRLAFGCTECGHTPDKRNLFRTYEYHKDKYSDQEIIPLHKVGEYEQKQGTAELHLSNGERQTVELPEGTNIEFITTPDES